MWARPGPRLATPRPTTQRERAAATRRGAAPARGRAAEGRAVAPAMGGVEVVDLIDSDSSDGDCVVVPAAPAAKRARTGDGGGAGGSAGRPAAAAAGDGIPRSAVRAQPVRMLSSSHVRCAAPDERVGLADVVEGDFEWAIVCDYLIDPAFLLRELPALGRCGRVCVFTDSRNSPRSTLGPALACAPAFELYYPPLPLQYGTHHSKLFVLVFDKGVRVVVHTSNLIYSDVRDMAQGLWTQDFPLKTLDQLGETSPFEDALVAYFEATKWPGTTVNGDRASVGVLRRFSFVNATAMFVASVPGRHTGASLKKWGHLAVREALRRDGGGGGDKDDLLALQYSSCGSMAPDKKTGDSQWLADELATSLCGGGAPVRDVRLVWPTVEEIRTSYAGYSSGNSVPGPSKNVLKPHLRARYHRLTRDGDDTGKRLLTPHIKTFVRMQSRAANSVAPLIRFYLLTSSNLSKAAWGQLQLKGTQLQVLSYEAGVLVTPTTLSNASAAAEFSCTPKAWRCSLEGSPSGGSDTPTRVVMLPLRGGAAPAGEFAIARLPVPYELPLEPYTAKDVPWVWDQGLWSGPPDRYGRFGNA